MDLLGVWLGLVEGREERMALRWEGFVVWRFGAFGRWISSELQNTLVIFVEMKGGNSGQRDPWLWMGSFCRAMRAQNLPLIDCRTHAIGFPYSWVTGGDAACLYLSSARND